METKWLEDFVSLAETRSFSRSAQLRHVTQPAFSRRIQALEAWAGIDLVDRSSYPTRLTPAGETFHAQSLEILGSLASARNMMRSYQAAGLDMIEFAAPHTLAFTFFPHWLMDLRQRFGNIKSRLTGLNVHDAVLRLTEGGYGFYYKGGQQNMVQQPSQDVLSDLQSVIPPVEVRPRSTEPAKPYNELITSKVYFSNEKWQECIASHGIVIDPTSKTLTVQSTATRQDFVYDLTDEELRKLTSNSIKEVPVQNRIDLINNVIKNDFQDKLTMDMLNSKEQIGLKLTPEVEAELNSRQQIVIDQSQPLVYDNQAVVEPEDRSVAHVDGNSLYEINEGKGWFREGKHGREVQVDDIKVEPVRDEKGEIQKDEKGNALFRMTAVINGESISHEITQKQYDKFMAIDDYHRMKLFSHIFKEVDMKNVPGMQSNIGAKIGGALLAGIAIMGELGRDRYAPAVFVEHHHDPRPHVYFKGSVDSPQDLASRAFDAGLNAGEHGVGMGHGR